MKAIVLAADKGFNIDGSVDDTPKALLPIEGKCLINYVLEKIDFIEKKHTIIIIGQWAGSVKEKLGAEYRYAEQTLSLGTGDAVYCAMPEIINEEDDVIVCYSDMPLISEDVYRDIIKKHKESNADCTILSAVAPKTGLKYGRIIRSNGNFAGIVEDDDCSAEQKKIDELNVGLYVFKAKELRAYITKLMLEDKKEYLITDIPELMLKDNCKIIVHTIDNSNQIYGINNTDQLKLCTEIIKHSKGIGNVKKDKWFGTGGWRALIGEEFTKDNVQILSQAIAQYMTERKMTDIVIGFDRRFLSDKAGRWAAEVFAGNNINVFFISRISPTPLVMFTVKNIKASMGMAITASHNPADYNGIKVFKADSSDVSADVTDIFEEIISKGVKPLPISFDEGVVNGRIRMIDPNNDYIDSIISMIDMQAIRKGNLRILLDPMYGVSKTTLQTILMTARCDVDIINDRHDTLFGGQLPSPTEKSLTKLHDMVLQQKYDLGVGTDGDADRIGIIDNEGNFIHPNQILVLLYYYLLKHKGWRGDCVRNIATTHILDKIAEKFGKKCHEVPVGFKHISAKMEETDAIIGGESSGGLTIKGHIKGKDGIFASALAVEMICHTNKTIPELLKVINEEFGSTYFIETEFAFTAQKKAELIELLFDKKELPKFDYPVKKVSYLDGCKVYFENDGWIIARFSGTEPLIRVFAEMPDKAMADDVINAMKKFLGL